MPGVLAGLLIDVLTLWFSGRFSTYKDVLGKLAWFFLVLNLSKLPIYIFLSANNPTNPIITLQSALLAVYTLPALAMGALAGKLALPRISQKAFETVVLVLAGGAVKLLIGV